MRRGGLEKREMVLNKVEIKIEILNVSEIRKETKFRTRVQI